MATITNRGYLVQCSEILNKLKNDLRHFQDGDVSYFKDIALRLRVLLIDKSGTKALLKTLEDIYDFKIYVLTKYTIQDKTKLGVYSESLSKKLEAGVAFYLESSVPTWFKEGHEKVSIFKAIEHEELKIGTVLYSHKRIIEVIADRMAAHIDRTIKDDDLILHDGSIVVGGLPIAQQGIIELGKALIFLLDSVIQHVENKSKFEWIDGSST